MPAQRGGFRKALFRGLEGETSTLGAKGRVRWKGGGRARVRGAGFTGGGCGSLGLVCGFGGLLDRVIYWVILQFPRKSIKNSFLDRVIY